MATVKKAARKPRVPQALKNLLSKKEKLLIEIKRVEETIKSNVAFDKLTKEQKRVAIAKDVIAAINAKQITIGHMGYITNPDLQDEIGSLSFNEEEDLQSLLLNSGTTCKVCAKGALFVTEVLKRDNFNVNGNFSLDDQDAMCEKLSDYFERGQLDLIEAAYEGTVMKDYDGDLFDNSDDEYEDEYGFSEKAENAIRFGGKYTNAKKRLIAILENLIKNKGTFKP